MEQHGKILPFRGTTVEESTEADISSSAYLNKIKSESMALFDLATTFQVDIKDILSDLNYVVIAADLADRQMLEPR